MKKEKISNIIISSLYLIMLFVPLEPLQNGYASVINIFLHVSKYYQQYYKYFTGWIWLLLIIATCLSLSLHISLIFKDKLAIKISATISTCVYIILWTIVLSDNRLKGAHILLLVLYISILLTIVGLTILQYLQYLPPRRPSKTARMQAQIDELQQQVDELTSKDDE